MGAKKNPRRFQMICLGHPILLRPMKMSELFFLFFSGNYSSDTSFYDEDDTKAKKVTPPFDASWRTVGNVRVWGTSYKDYIHFQHYVFLGPDWIIAIIANLAILAFSIWLSNYLALNVWENVIRWTIQIAFIGSFLILLLADSGYNTRKFHHARSRHWAYCDDCESFVPPGTVHCASCCACCMLHSHHMPLIGKCIGAKNILYYRCYQSSLACTIILWLFVNLSRVL